MRNLFNALQGKVSLEKGFFGGLSIRKWGLASFGVSVLKLLITNKHRFRIYIVPLYSPGNIIKEKGSQKYN